MFPSIGLTLSGLFFTILIAIVYFSKKKYDSIENNIYRSLIVITLFLLVLEVVCVYTMSIRNSIPVLNEFFCRLFILFVVLWFMTMIGYMGSITTKKTYKTSFEFFGDKPMIIMIIFSSICYFVSCFLDIKYTSSSGSHTFYVIGGSAVYVLYVVLIFFVIYMIKVLSSDLNKQSAIKRLPIFLFLILLSIIGIVQLFLVDLNELSFLCAFSVVAMYFTLENQDIMLVSELEVAKKEAEEADKEKTEFLSKMSHEIRTPMNAIMGFSESLLNKSTVTEDEIKKDVKNIYNAGKNLLEIINNILIFSRIESGKEKLELVDYNLLDIISELQSFVNSKIDKTKVKFNIKINKDIPAVYNGDKLKIYRILLNLLNNATRYTEKGQINLNVDFDKNTDDSGNLIFEITDTGTGMNEQELSKLFNEFKNINNNEEKKDSIGTGLGFAVVKQLLNVLDGKIEFHSEYAVGTIFKISLLQKIVNNSTIKDLDIESDNTKKLYFNCSKYRILIVDDNKLNLKVIEKLLKQYKIQFESINNGRECIDKVKTGEKYDLILLDHMMPELDGIETIRILKKLKNIKLPPIVAMTANVVTELKETYFKEGFDDYISKPIDIKELNILMKKYFKRNANKIRRGK